MNHEACELLAHTAIDAAWERWKQEARHDRRQLWFWFGVVVIAALGIIFR